jgi:hypothetical protein
VDFEEIWLTLSVLEFDAERQGIEADQVLKGHKKTEKMRNFNQLDYLDRNTFYKQGEINRQEHNCVLSVFLFRECCKIVQELFITSGELFTNLKKNPMIRADRNSS